MRPEAIRKARLEAGLSLEKLAHGQVSRQAIHQVEAGKIRPSLRLLRLIAEATGKPLSFFLDEQAPEIHESSVSEVERRWYGRDFAGAIALGTQILRADPKPGPAVEGEVRLWLGAAHVGANQADDALAHLSRARALLEAAGESRMVVEAMDWEACALHLKDAPTALALAERALLECRRLDPLPSATEARILGHIGAISVAHRAWRKALIAFEGAIEAGRSVRDLRQLALMHHNLAIIHQRLGSMKLSMASAQRALALYSAHSAQADLARLENDLGDLLLKQGQLEPAERHLRNALDAFTALGEQRRGPNYTLLGLGELAIARGRHSEAASLLAAAKEGATKLDEKVALACAHQLLGRLASRMGNTVEANREFETALSLLEALAMPERTADCHLEFAGTLEQQGDLLGANRHLREAAELVRGVPMRSTMLPEEPAQTG